MYSWYQYLNKPFLSPPDFVFSVVWTILYTMMIISFVFFIKGKFTDEKLLPFVMFFVQLTLNLLWSPVFFYFHNMTLALVVVILMIIVTFITIILFYRTSKVSAILLIPYLLWIIFAAYLNYQFIQLN